MGRSATRVRPSASARRSLASDPLFADLKPAAPQAGRPPPGGRDRPPGRGDSDAAVAAEEQALDAFREELTGSASRLAVAEKDVAAAEFQQPNGDQTRNRAAADALAAASARLGDAGSRSRRT